MKFKPSQVNRNAQNDACQSCISLPLGGLAQTDKSGQSFGLPLGTGSKRSQESESSGRYDLEQNTGPQLKINIKNVAKLKEDTHVKDEVDIYEPPKHKRGWAQPDEPIEESIDYSGSDNADYMMKNTSVAEARNDKFKQIWSEIIPSFLYLGSDFLARDKDILVEYGITHIINSAGDYSPNYYDEDFKYLTFHLKDHPRENIEWIFYEAINFIENAQKENGKVFVHWVQGISRSATICLAYIILSNGLDYNEAFEFIQKKREVINPNLGFIIQLMWFHKRLYKPFDSIPVNPRVFTVCSHEREDPHRIVAKLMMEQFFIDKHSKSMDSRAVYIVESKEEFVIFIGEKCKDKNRDEYLKFSYKYIAELQKREKAPSKVTEVEQSNVDKSFWSIWGLEEAPITPFDQTSAWDLWFPNLEHSEGFSNVPMVQQIDDYNEEIKIEKNLKPRMFTYPDKDASSAVFDEEDLEYDDFNVICVRARKPEEPNIIYIYEGESFEERGGLTKNDFIQKVIQKHFKDVPKDKLIHRYNRVNEMGVELWLEDMEPDYNKNLDMLDESDFDFFTSKYFN